MQGNALFVGDVHLKGSSPESRSDDYPKTILNKLDYISDICVNNNVSHIFFLGDLFDTVQIGFAYFSECFSKFVELSSKFSVYTIIGNHDIRYDRLDSIDSCPLGILIKTNVIKLLSTPLRLNNVMIYGYSWNEEIEECKITSEHSVCLLHKFYQSGFNEIPITQEDCINKKYSSYILGHDHRPYETIHLNSCSIYRPGSLSRNSGDTYNRIRIPRVLLLDTENLKYKYIEISNALKPENIFRTQKQQIDYLNIVPQITNAWNHSENNPRNFCSEFPEDVKLIICNYLDQIGI